MTSAPARPPSFWILALTTAAYALFLYLLLPPNVVLLDDDFGYLKSVIQTFQHRRPWTDDFLEPWNVATSSLSAVAFALTGNFHFSTYGLQAIFGAASLPALCALLCARGFSVRTTFVVAGLLLTFPVLLWRALEFTGMALYVPCLIWAIWAAERQRWGVFAFVFLLAIANRQSAAVWLALPGYAVLHAARSSRGAGLAQARAPIAVIFGGLAAIALLHAGMNSTDSQRMLLYETLSRFEFGVARRTIVSGAVVFFLAVGVSASLLSLSQRPPARRAAWPALFLLRWILVAVVLLVFDERSLAIIDRIDVGWRGGWLYTKLLVAVALAGWIGFHFRLRPAPVLGAAVSLILCSLRPSVWDYYFIDVALLGFFAVVPRPVNSAVPQAPGPFLFRHWKPAFLVALGVIGLFHLLSTLHLKSVLDEAHAITRLYERALRHGQLRQNETADAHFGFGGWHLFAHGIARRGNSHTRWFSALFTAPAKSVELAVAYPDSFPLRWRHENHTPPGTEVVPLAEHTACIAWFWRCHYQLQRRAPPAEPSTLGPDFRPIIFPLNDAEWRELAAGPPLQ